MIGIICFRTHNVRSDVGVHIEDGFPYRVGPAVAHFNAKSVVIEFNAHETNVCDREIKERTRMS